MPDRVIKLRHADAEYMDVTRPGLRLTVVAVAVAVTLCGAVAAWAFTQDSSDVPTYKSAQAMAQRAGCADTFRTVSNPAGFESAGECTISGEVVALYVARDINTVTMPWPTKNYVGTNWVAHSNDLKTLQTVGPRLAS